MAEQGRDALRNAGQVLAMGGIEGVRLGGDDFQDSAENPIDQNRHDQQRTQIHPPAGLRIHARIAGGIVALDQFRSAQANPGEAGIRAQHDAHIGGVAQAGAAGHGPGIADGDGDTFGAGNAGCFFGSHAQGSSDVKPRRFQRADAHTRRGRGIGPTGVAGRSLSSGSHTISRNRRQIRYHPSSVWPTLYNFLGDKQIGFAPEGVKSQTGSRTSRSGRFSVPSR